MTDAKKKTEKDPFGRPIENHGIGMNEDGTVNVVTPEQMQARMMEINAAEALEAGDDDYSDLEEDE